MNDKKYDPAGPTRRIEDWKPFTGATQPLPRDGAGATARAGGGGDGRNQATQYVPDPPAKGDKQTGRVDEKTGVTDFMADPVVGFLVIVKGPGKGKDLRLGLGMNTIGRDSSNRIQLDYGDKQISRERHCVVTFEPKRRVFYIQNESGQNLTYVGDVVVLQPQELRAGETITIGGTELRFIPLCGADFSWESTEA